VTEYNWQLLLVAFHVVAIIAWMAGMLYLPRLFVYHADAELGSDKSETFKIMERRLLRAIMNPAMIAALASGVALALWQGPYRDPWLMAKAVLVLALVAVHGWLSGRRKDFERDANTRSARTYRMMNEVPTVLMIGIVILVVVRPF
jgi:putative membrane protein